MGRSTLHYHVVYVTDLPVDVRSGDSTVRFSRLPIFLYRFVVAVVLTFPAITRYALLRCADCG